MMGEGMGGVRRRERKRKGSRTGRRSTEKENKEEQRCKKCFFLFFIIVDLKANWLKCQCPKIIDVWS